jgi:16S rRNA processing protein RimM
MVASPTPLPLGQAGVLPADAVALGAITGAHGVRGEVKIKAFSAQPDALLGHKRWWLTPPEAAGGPRFAWFEGAVHIGCLSCRAAGVQWVARLDGVSDRETAQGLRGVTIWLPRSAFPEPATDEYYWVDLIGLQVRNRQAVCLGVVGDIMETGAAPVLVVQEEAYGPHLIPFVAAYIDRVDLTVGTVTVDWQAEYSR